MMRAKYTALIDDCRRRVTSHLRPLLSNLFENADVVLLEFAEKAESNAAQQRFFEAMKEIQVKRDALEQVFLEELQLCFRRFKDSSLDRVSTDGIVVKEENQDFSLVAKDTVEEGVALQNMITRAHLHYANEMHALRQRLALVIGGRKLEEEEIPGGPRQLGECYRTATRQLALEPKIKLVVFVLFDKFVISQLGGLYQEYNNRLVEEGLLPHLKYEIRKTQDTGIARPRRPDPDTGHAPRQATMAAAGHNERRGRQTVGEETFEAICELLARRRPAAGYAEASPADDGRETLSRPMLVSALNHLQQLDQASPLAQDVLDAQLIPELQLDARLIDEIKLTLVQQREKLYGGVDRRRVASADADVIDLVGMIFEFMLNDETIPNAVKALLSRLHTPFLKVAILDRQFFTQEDHPVRELLNTLADAGARYVVEDDLRRGIFPYMRAAVNRILDEFDDQLAVFAEVQAEFRGRLEQMQHTAEITEQRSREAASGQERLQHARQRSRELVDAAMQGRVLLPAIEQLLRQAWADKLMFILLRDRDGEQSPFWKEALRLMEEIVESTRLRQDEADREELRTRLPEIQAGLSAGLERVAGFGNDDTGSLYELIVDSQYAALDRPWVDGEGMAAAGQRDRGPREPSPRDPARDAADMTPVASAGEHRLQQQLAELEFGTWFEFTVPGEPPPRRLKLAWYTQQAGNYMFVDKLGVRAMVRTREELARDMAAGRARLLRQEKQPFVDRAMEAVRSLLRRGEKISA